MLKRAEHALEQALVSNQNELGNETESLSASVLASEMGCNCSDKEILATGRNMSAKYRSKCENAQRTLNAPCSCAAAFSAFMRAEHAL